MLRPSPRNRFLRDRLKGLFTKTASTQFKPDPHQDIDQGNLKPDIYTTPDPRATRVKKINWKEVASYVKARKFHAYPSTIHMFNPMIAMDINTRKLPHNRPEKWGNRIIKDKVMPGWTKKKSEEKI